MVLIEDIMISETSFPIQSVDTEAGPLEVEHRMPSSIVYLCYRRVVLLVFFWSFAPLVPQKRDLRDLSSLD